MLLLNNDGAPVLTVGRRDWKDLHGRSAISLSIDGGKPRALSMSFAYNIGLLAVSDSGLLGDLGVRTDQEPELLDPLPGEGTAG